MAIAKKIRKLENDQEKIPEEKLKGFKNISRIRVGRYRLVFIEVKGGIEIFLIAHRREVYALLRQLF